MSSDVARVLKVFALYESRAGDVLLANHFVSVGRRQGWDIPALQDEIDEAYARGLIEKAALGWRLTAKGFGEVSDLRLPLAQR